MTVLAPAGAGAGAGAMCVARGTCVPARPCSTHPVADGSNVCAIGLTQCATGCNLCPCVGAPPGPSRLYPTDEGCSAIFPIHASSDDQDLVRNERTLDINIERTEDDKFQSDSIGFLDCFVIIGRRQSKIYALQNGSP